MGEPSCTTVDMSDEDPVDFRPEIEDGRLEGLDSPSLAIGGCGLSVITSGLPGSSLVFRCARRLTRLRLLLEDPGSLSSATASSPLCALSFIAPGTKLSASDNSFL